MGVQSIRETPFFYYENVGESLAILDWVF